MTSPQKLPLHTQTAPHRHCTAAETAYWNGLIDKAQWIAHDDDEKACQDPTNCFNLLSYVVLRSCILDPASTHITMHGEPKSGSRTFPPRRRVGECDRSGDVPCTLEPTVPEGRS